MGLATCHACVPMNSAPTYRRELANISSYCIFSTYLSPRPQPWINQHTENISSTVFVTRRLASGLAFSCHPDKYPKCSIIASRLVIIIRFVFGWRWICFNICTQCFLVTKLQNICCSCAPCTILKYIIIRYLQVSKRDAVSWTRKFRQTNTVQGWTGLTFKKSLLFFVTIEILKSKVADTYKLVIGSNPNI